MAPSTRAQTVRTIGMLATVGVAVSLAGGAAAQVTPGSQQGLGLTGADIPPILKAVEADPYRYPAEPACESIPQEILALDQVLGPDVDGEKAKSSKVHMALNYARGMIPYHGYVRFLTRADAKDKALRDAATAGVARRGFLRGLEAHLRCAPASNIQAADTQVADASAKAPEIKPVDLKVADLKIAVAAPAPAPLPAPGATAGDELARQMLTPVSSPAAPAVAPTPALAESPPVSSHVVYRWVDAVSGRPIVPDPDPPAGR
ncbi:hypothetical protein [Phenylobacterium sp.]|uniref:hypothetical protein n=1 Tax=Phenylobacterium sp. TaxID=1871053 RepID=UPI002B8C4EBA|nr:hypothetical protein [Phenylobacterium sp.]HLZ74499.1 hypothetical protein [Phenylobacterium sp.]